MTDGTLAAAHVLKGTKRLAASGGAVLLGLIRTLGLVVIAVVAAVFFIQDLATIEVAFLTWSISAPRAFIFLLVFGMGLTAGYLLSALSPRRQAGGSIPKAT
jgi:lipopolysaccharide assembly protein A